MAGHPTRKTEGHRFVIKALLNGSVIVRPGTQARKRAAANSLLGRAGDSLPFGDQTHELGDKPRERGPLPPYRCRTANHLPDAGRFTGPVQAADALPRPREAVEVWRAVA